MAQPEREERLLDRMGFRDQLLTRDGAAADARITPEAMPETKDASLEGQGVATEPLRCGGVRQCLSAQYIPGDVRPAELALARGVR